MDLSALLDFHLVVDAGSFSRASRESGRPKATLSRRVRALEQSLGLRLLERGRHALYLTEEGRALFERTRGLVREIDEVGQDLISGAASPRGLLRVSAPVLFATTFGGRIAAVFAQRHPLVQLELVGEDRRVDLIEDGYDVAIRVNPLPDTELVGQCFARDRMLLVAAPSLLPPAPNADGSPSRVAAVAMRGLSQPASWRVEHDGSSREVVPDSRLRLSSLLMVRDAALAGAGAACLPHSIIRDDLATGRLVAWSNSPEEVVELWVLHASRRLVTPKVRAFLEHLAAAFPLRLLEKYE